MGYIQKSNYAHVFGLADRCFDALEIRATGSLHRETH